MKYTTHNNHEIISVLNTDVEYVTTIDNYQDGIYISYEFATDINNKLEAIKVTRDVANNQIKYIIYQLNDNEIEAYFIESNKQEEIINIENNNINND